MRNIHTQTLTDLSARFIVPSGVYKGLLFVFDGDTQASQDWTAALMGNVTINVDGRQKSQVDLDMLQALNGFDFGATELQNTTGAAFRSAAYLPLVDFVDDAAYHLTPDKRMEILASFTGATATIVETGNFKCFGLTADETLLTPYELRYNNHHLSIGAAGTFTFKIHQDNIRRLLVESDAQLTSLAVKKDGKNSYDTIDKDDLQCVTNLFNSIETFSASQAYVTIDLVGGSDEEAAQNDDVEVIVTAAAACTLDIIVESMDITPNKLAKSIGQAENATKTKINNKIGKGVNNIATALEANLLEAE